MSNILKLKKANKGNALATMKSHAESYNTKQNYKDDRYWQPVVDKNNTGNAIIRFLPGIQIKDSEEYEQPFVRKWSHGFKGPTGLWYIENNLNTLDNANDPCTDYNSQLWKTGDSELREQARRQKRKLSYISNILVLKHPARPDDEGKVFLYQYGQKVFDKVMEKMIPPEDELDPDNTPDPVNVFDLWEGANLRLRIKNVEGFRNYDSSTFDAPKPISDDDAELEAIFSQEHSLLTEVAPDKFKSYAELQKRLFEVLDIAGDKEDEAPRSETPKKPTAVKSTIKMEESEVPFDVDEDGVVTDKPVTTSSTGSEFFKRLKAAKA